MKPFLIALLGGFALAYANVEAQCTFYAPPPAGLVASYPFNNNLVETLSNSATGTTNNGATYTTDRFGNANSALSFSNSNSTTALNKEFVLLNNPGIFSGEFTIVYWFKTDNTQNNRRMYMFAIDSLVTSANLDMELNDGNAFWCYWNSQGLPGFAGESINQYQDNLWHMVVFRRDSTKIDFFIDMDLKASYPVSAGTIGTNSPYRGGKISLGHRETPSTPAVVNEWGFNGQIDDLSLYNGAVSTQALSNYYNNYDLAGWFPFSGNPSDSSGCANIVTPGTSTGNNIDLPSLTSNRFGTPNSAYHFNGNSILKVTPFSANALLGCINFFSNDFSVSFWSRTAADNRRQYALSVDRSVSATHDNFAIEFNDSDVPSPGLWTFWNGQGFPGITAAPMNTYSDSLWHFITVTRQVSSGRVTAYVDADTVGTYIDTTAVIGNNTDTMDIGHLRAPYSLSLGFDYGFIGDLDEFKFHRHALSLAEIQAAYTNTNTAYRNVVTQSKPSAPTEVTVYPNPGSSVLYVRSTKAFNHVEVTDLMGTIIATGLVNGTTCELELNTAPGVYIIQVYNQANELLHTGKLIRN